MRPAKTSLLLLPLFVGSCGPLVSLDDLAEYPQHLSSEITPSLRAEAFGDAARTSFVLSPSQVPEGGYLQFSLVLQSEPVLHYAMHAIRMTAGPAGLSPVIDVRYDEYPEGTAATSASTCWHFGGFAISGPVGETWLVTLEAWTSRGRVIAEYEVQIGDGLVGDEAPPLKAWGCPAVSVTRHS